MPDVEQFVPAPAELGANKSELRDAIAVLRPDVTDAQFDAHWSSFLMMRGRVNTPRRRIGTSVSRCGPVLFDPCQYLNRG